MHIAGRLRYYQAGPLAPASLAPHSEFLRTGRIMRQDGPLPEGGKRYLSREHVAERTGQRLANAGQTTHQRINSFHREIRFPKAIFYRVLDDIPHLGYCHVTTAGTPLANRDVSQWSFYIANFSAEISETYPFFENIDRRYARMYFAVALEKAPGDTLRIDRSIRRDGLLFRTNNPQEALRNVLLLGAPTLPLHNLIKNHPFPGL